MDFLYYFGMVVYGVSFISCVWDIIHYEEVLAENPAASATGRSRRFIFGTLVLFGMEFTFWYKFFRYPSDGARVFAAFMGINLILIILAG